MRRALRVRSTFVRIPRVRDRILCRAFCVRNRRPILVPHRVVAWARGPRRGLMPPTGVAVWRGSRRSRGLSDSEPGHYYRPTASPFDHPLAVTRHQPKCIMHSLLIVHDSHGQNRCRARHEHQQPPSNQPSREQTASHPRDRCASQTGSESGENIAMHRRVAPIQK